MFGKKSPEKLQASKRIVFEKLQDDDKRAAELVEELIDNNPVVVNFTELDPMAYNKMLAFLSGASYALDGETVKIKEDIYLFAKKEEFLEGSLRDFIERTRDNQ